MYFLKRKIKKCELKDAIVIKGISNTPKNKSFKNVVIVDKSLRDKYAIRQMDSHLRKAYSKIYKFLTSDDDSSEGVKICLGEIEKCKAALFNKYKEDLQKSKYKEYIIKIAITEEEFKNKYREREYYASLIDKMYREMNEARDREEYIGRGR